MRISLKHIAIAGVGFCLATQVVVIRELIKTQEAVEELGSMMLFNLQREFTKQIDEEFENIVERIDDDPI